MLKKWSIYCITESVNVYTILNSPPTTCPNNAAHTVNPDSVQIRDPLFSGGHLFGDGSDGDVTISVNTSLTRDMYYRSLTVTSGAIVTPNGYRIFIGYALYLNNGYISANGGNAASMVGGTAAYPATVLGSGSAGGTGGTGSGTLPTVGSALASLTQMGGLGGAGGLASIAGAAGGTGTVPAESTGGNNVFINVLTAIRGRDLANTQMNGGSGGGGGSGGSPGGYTGGGGGGGAGILLISARYISIISGSISANGGNGANGTVTGNGGGGGGGGGGGAIVIISTTDTALLSITVTGGTAGIGGGVLGAAGVAGNIGQIFRILI